jgi:hypothetical protein
MMEVKATATGTPKPEKTKPREPSVTPTPPGIKEISPARVATEYPRIKTPKFIEYPKP